MAEYDPDFDFKGHADRMLLCVSTIAESVDLDQMQTVFSYTHALGSMLDPTAYRDALQRGDMERTERLAALLQPVVAYWNESVAPSLPTRRV